MAKKGTKLVSVVTGKRVSNEVSERALKFADYLINDDKTVREIAKVCEYSKSTVHKDLTEHIASKRVYNAVRKVLNKHLAERHINGGIATKNKYAAIK